MKSKYTYIWVTGVFSILILILFLVVEYKVKYEDRIIYEYLYFYNCNDLCSTTNFNEIEDKSKIYSVYKYTKDTPSYNKLGSDFIEINKNYLYNYVRGEVIANNHSDYKLISSNNIYLFIGKDNDSKYSIIDSKGIIKYNKYDLINTYDNVLALIKDNTIILIDVDCQVLNKETITYDESTTITYNDNVISINNGKNYTFNTNSMEWGE